MATALTMATETALRCGLDVTVAANRTRIDRIADLIQQDFCGRDSWSFLREREIITTTADYVTGTADFTKDSATVTGTSTVWTASHVRWFIQAPSSDWYEVTARASNTSITITPAYQGTTATAQTYILRQVYYSLSTSAESVLDVRQFQSPRKLQCFGYRTVDTYRPNLSATGYPVGYYLFRLDPAVSATASKQIQMVFEPSPSIAMIMEVRIKKLLADFSATDGNISQVPVRWHPTMIDGMEALLKLHLNDPGFQNARDRYELGIGKAMAEDRSIEDRLVVMGGYQEAPVSRWLPFPSAFEQPR